MWVSGFDKAGERVNSKEADRVSAVQVLGICGKVDQFYRNEKT